MAWSLQANYHHKTFSMNRNLWSYLFSTLYNKQMHVARVPNLALLSKYSLRVWSNAAGFPVRHYYLPLCRATYKIFSLHDNSTYVTWRFETSFFKIHHYQAEVSIKNRLPHNWSLFTTACPYKIWQSYLEKPATYLTLYASL